MSPARIAIVSSDDDIRTAAVRAFDHAPVDWEVSLHRSPPPDADVVVSDRPLEAAVPFEPDRPDELVARVRAALGSKGGRVIGVVGSTGGCGATTVALHLAAEAEGPTCFVDLDDAPHAALRLGLSTEEFAAQGGEPVPVPPGFRMMWSGQTEPGVALGAARAGFRSVVADLPRSGYRDVLHHCDAIVIVLNPTVPAARRALPLLDACDDMPHAIVCNRLGPGGETTIAAIQRRLGRRVALQLPTSRALRDREDEGHLAPEWSPWRWQVRRLAHLLCA